MPAGPKPEHQVPVRRTHVAPGQVEDGVAVGGPLRARLVRAPVISHLGWQLAGGVHDGHVPLLIRNGQQLAVVVVLQGV